MFYLSKLSFSSLLRPNLIPGYAPIAYIALCLSGRITAHSCGCSAIAWHVKPMGGRNEKKKNPLCLLHNFQLRTNDVSQAGGIKILSALDLTQKPFERMRNGTVTTTRQLQSQNKWREKKTKEKTIDIISFYFRNCISCARKRGRCGREFIGTVPMLLFPHSNLLFLSAHYPTWPFLAGVIWVTTVSTSSQMTKTYKQRDFIIIRKWLHSVNDFDKWAKRKEEEKIWNATNKKVNVKKVSHQLKKKALD